MNGEHVTRVSIFGQSYLLRAKEGPEYVRKVAHYVDGKFYDVAEREPSLPVNKIAILSALDIADELFKSKEEKEKTEELVRAKIDEIIDLIGREIGKEEEVWGIGASLP